MIIADGIEGHTTPVAALSDSIQNPFSTLCGEYCFFFAYHLSRNFNLKNVTNFFTNDIISEMIKI